MRFRAAHLACVMLLLSAFGAADAHALAAGRLARRGQPVGILFQPSAASLAENIFARDAAEPSPAALPGAPVGHTRPAWALRPPAAHTLAQHAATGSSL